MKDRRKTIRISKEEEQKLLDSLKDTGMNFSDYVRKAISDHPIIVVSGIQDLHLQVARVGNNRTNWLCWPMKEELPVLILPNVLKCCK